MPRLRRRAHPPRARRTRLPRLTETELHALRSSAVDELVNAVRHGAPLEHINGVVAVLDVVDARLSGAT